MPKPELQPAEEVLLSYRANHTQGSKARGGKLFLTSDRLLFRPGRVDRALGGHDLDLLRADVVEASVAPRTGNRTDGGMRRRLRVLLRDGSEELFVVNGVEKVTVDLQHWLVSLAEPPPPPDA